ncbi:hypothetical protein NLI96_g1692 [Meripilus lineatus]|uniref:Vacuolar ATPase assembly integral membrane protein VMA21 n=1 Tax=Meripilus lineatus TaxID=2056292 RepID=A0AAD5V9X9_9APHY|nr:hypothetical protein NLI96_g1692 [Physisporinus lineatus]
MSDQIAAARIADQADQGRVLAKLIAFTLALGILPLTSYFVSEKYIWEGNSTFAAVTAIVAANLVLVAYIIVSIQEENRAASSTAPSEVETKKTQ